MTTSGTRFLNPAYRVGDLDRSLDFYGVLGFEERARYPGHQDSVHIFLGLPTEVIPRLQLIHRPSVSNYDLGNGYDHLSLDVEDLDATLRRLASLGVKPDGPPRRPEGGDGPLACYVRDPDGYEIMLIGADRSLDATPAIEASVQEEAARRKAAAEPSTNDILPTDNGIGREGVEELWAERFPRYPRLRHDGHSSLRVRVYPEKGIKRWLRGGRRNIPEFIEAGSGQWEMPYAWRDEMIVQLANHYGGVLVFRDAASVEKCAPACVKARSPVTSCECACGGINHGTGSLPVGFHVISEALAVRVSDTEQVTVTFVRPLDGAERGRRGLI